MVCFNHLNYFSLNLELSWRLRPNQFRLALKIRQPGYFGIWRYVGCTFGGRRLPPKTQKNEGPQTAGARCGFSSWRRIDNGAAPAPTGKPPPCWRLWWLPKKNADRFQKNRGATGAKKGAKQAPLVPVWLIRLLRRHFRFPSGPNVAPPAPSCLFLEARLVPPA